MAGLLASPLAAPSRSVKNSGKGEAASDPPAGEFGLQLREQLSVFTRFPFNSGRF